MKSKILKTTLGITACLAVAGVTYAAVILNPDGTGFVGKGNVQTIYGWNNKALQDNAGDVMFRAFSETETVSTWTCSRINAAGREVVTPRNNETTLTTPGLLSKLPREKSNGKDGPITGFNLLGYDGTPLVVPVTDGQPLYSCPPAGGPGDPFTYDDGSFESETTEVGSGVQVTNNGTDWTDLQ
jgi:hypothetical protein